MSDRYSRSAFYDNFYYIKGKHRHLRQQSPTLQVVLGAAVNFSLLSQRHGLNRSAIPGISTCLDLYKAYTATFLSNNVYFTIAVTAKVAGQNCITLILQIAAGKILPIFTKTNPRSGIHNYHAVVQKEYFLLLPLVQAACSSLARSCACASV